MQDFFLFVEPEFDSLATSHILEHGESHCFTLFCFNHLLAFALTDNSHYLDEKAMDRVKLDDVYFNTDFRGVPIFRNTYWRISTFSGAVPVINVMRFPGVRIGGRPVHLPSLYHVDFANIKYSTDSALHFVGSMLSNSCCYCGQRLGLWLSAV